MCSPLAAKVRRGRRPIQRLFKNGRFAEMAASNTNDQTAFVVFIGSLTATYTKSSVMALVHTIIKPPGNKPNASRLKPLRPKTNLASAGG